MKPVPCQTTSVEHRKLEMKIKRERTLFFLRALTPTKPHFKCFLLLLLIPRFFRFFWSLMFFFGFLLRKTEGEALGVWIWNVKRGIRRRRRRRREKGKKAIKQNCMFSPSQFTIPKKAPFLHSRLFPSRPSFSLFFLVRRQYKR